MSGESLQIERVSIVFQFRRRTKGRFVIDGLCLS